MRHCGVGLLLWMSMMLVPLWAGTDQEAPTTNLAAEVQPLMQVNPATPRSRIFELKGTLKDRQGKRLTGVVGVLFSIYAEMQTGPIFWQEVQNVNVGDQGGFAVKVGATKSEGIPPEVFASGKARWLGMQVLLPGEVEQPRLKLVSRAGGINAERISTSSRLREQTLSKRGSGASDNAATPAKPSDQPHPDHQEPSGSTRKPKGKKIVALPE